MGLLNFMRRMKNSGVLGGILWRPVLNTLVFGALLWNGSAVIAQNAPSETGIFAEIRPCDSYIKFLDMKATTVSEDCHQLIGFLLRNEQVGVTEFLRNVKTEFSETSGLRYIANMQEAIVWGDVPMSYYWADYADRHIYFGLMRSGDSDRALFYVRLLAKIKYLAIQSVCFGEGDCENLASNPVISDILELDNDHLKGKRPDLITLCLLRSDGFVVPIEQVLDSARFKACLDDPR